jgi:hypothetical protein
MDLDVGVVLYADNNIWSLRSNQRFHPLSLVNKIITQSIPPTIHSPKMYNTIVEPMNFSFRGENRKIKPKSRFETLNLVK